MTARTKQIDWLRSIHDSSLKSLQDWAARLATWLVIGNASALVLGYTAILDGSPCGPAALAGLMWPFILGLLLAFSGAVISFLIGGEVTKLTGDTINTLATIEMNEQDLVAIEAESGPQPGNSPLHKSINEHSAKLPVLMCKLEANGKAAKRVLWLYGLSVAAFSAGILLPTISGGLQAACLP